MYKITVKKNICMPFLLNSLNLSILTRVNGIETGYWYCGIIIDTGMKSITGTHRKKIVIPT